MLKAKEVNDYSEFAELRSQWNHVLGNSEDNNVFLTWEWLSTWWRHYGKGRELVRLLALEEENILAVAPLMFSSYEFFGFKLKKLEFLGAEHTDYCNFILAERR